MNFVPIFTRELRCRNYRLALYKQRSRTAAAAGVALIALVLTDRWAGGLNLARLPGLGPFGGVIPFMFFIMGLHGAGTLLSVERREGTLPLLILTRLAGWDIIFGKLLQALMGQIAVFLAAAPALLLPMLALGVSFTEAWFLALGFLNLNFFSLALGLLGAVFGDTRVSASWCLFFFLPVLICSTPFVLLLPGAAVHWLVVLEWLDPCAPIVHAQAAAAGFRPEVFWRYLFVTHAVGWAFVMAAGLLLPHAVRWQAGSNAGKRRAGGWWRAWSMPTSMRTRLLERNPFLWLNSRERWGQVVVWLWLLFPAAGWGWMIWLIWSWRALNVAVVFVMAIGLSWAVSLLAMIPAYACRQLVADRLSGALELILCTPASVESIVRGVWLSVRRRFLAPVMTVLVLSAGLMISGYVTSGFGGMLDSDDRPRWLLAWSTGIVFLPFTLFTLCWVSIRRTLFARNVGEASAIGFLQVFGTLGVVLWTVYMMGGHSNSAALAAVLLIAAAITLLAFALDSRRKFLAQLRLAAASEFCEMPEIGLRARLSLLLCRVTGKQPINRRLSVGSSS